MKKRKTEDLNSKFNKKKKKKKMKLKKNYPQEPCKKNVNPASKEAPREGLEEVARVWLSDIIIGLFPNKKRRNLVQKFRDGGLAGGGALTNRGSQRLPPKRNRRRGDPTDLNIKKERDFGSLK